MPAAANAVVLERLKALGAGVNVCERREGESGDPSYLRFREALGADAIAFGCQGPDNGLTIDGGRTLGFELAETVAAAGEGLDRLFVQVGGGALASAVMQALREATRAGVIARPPALHAVQSRGGYPLERAYRRIVAQLGAKAGESADAVAARLAAPGARTAVDAVLAAAAVHRADYMWPWAEAPRSIADGILDDECYDWLAVVRAMLETGGYPVLASERTLGQANEHAVAATGIAADPTGTAGGAGLLELVRAGGLEPGESIALLFTGVRRCSPRTHVSAHSI